MITFTEKIAKLKNSRSIARTERGQVKTELNGCEPDVQPTRDTVSTRPEVLIEVIKQQQKKYVRISFGTNAGECFTDEDLESFNESGIPNQISSELRQDYAFLDVVRAVRSMRPTERQRLLQLGANTAKRTWREIGQITPEGQTEAGHTAELSIARSIVKLVRDLVALPEEDFQRLYRQ